MQERTGTSHGTPLSQRRPTRRQPNALRLLALAQLGGFVCAGMALVEPFARAGVWDWSARTIYPWWTLLLTAVGAMLAGVVLVRGPGVIATGAAAASGVLAAQLTGTGVVGFKHMRPAFGMGGGYLGGLDHLKDLAVVVALGGLVALVASIGLLVVAGSFRARTPWRALALIAGAALMGGLPLLMAQGSGELMDASSLGAFVLIYAGPWGGAVVVAGFLEWPAAVGALVACVVSSVLAVLGPQMQSLVLVDATWAFAAATALLVVVAARVIRRAAD